MIRLAFNKLETFESELAVIDGSLLKFSISISITALYARNISFALRLMSTTALIFSLCVHVVCVCVHVGGGGMRETKVLKENYNVISSRRPIKKF